MIDRRFRKEAELRFKAILDKAFMYGDVMEHISVNRTKSSSTDGPSEYTIELKLEFKSTEVDIANLEEYIQKIMDTEYPGSPNS